MTAIPHGACDTCGHVGPLDDAGRRCRGQCPPGSAGSSVLTLVDRVGKPVKADVHATLKRMGMKRTRGRQAFQARAAVATKVEDRMNKLERGYAYDLDSQKQAGKVIAWTFQSVRIRLSFAAAGEKRSRKSAWYTPDFLVIGSDGTIYFDETKGFWREASKVRIRTAADLFPWFRFRSIERKNGRFSVTTVD